MTTHQQGRETGPVVHMGGVRVQARTEGCSATNVGGRTVQTVDSADDELEQSYWSIIEQLVEAAATNSNDIFTGALDDIEFLPGCEHLPLVARHGLVLSVLIDTLDVACEQALTDGVNENRAELIAAVIGASITTFTGKGPDMQEIQARIEDAMLDAGEGKSAKSILGQDGMTGALASPGETLLSYITISKTLNWMLEAGGDGILWQLAETEEDTKAARLGYIFDELSGNYAAKGGVPRL